MSAPDRMWVTGMRCSRNRSDLVDYSNGPHPVEYIRRDAFPVEEIRHHSSGPVYDSALTDLLCNILELLGENYE